MGYLLMTELSNNSLYSFIVHKLSLGNITLEVKGKLWLMLLKWTLDGYLRRNSHYFKLFITDMRPCRELKKLKKDNIANKNDVLHTINCTLFHSKCFLFFTRWPKPYIYITLF